MRIRTVAVALVAAFALATACKKNEVETAQTKTTSNTPASPDDRTKPANLASQDTEFLTKAAEGGMLEVKLGTEAQQKATSPRVKAFGDRMVVDHGRANDELKALASEKGVTLPTTLDGDHEKKVEEFSKLSGAKFDEKFAKDMVEDHKEDVDEFEKASKDLKDPDIRAWAAKTLPTLRTHLDMAKGLEDKSRR